eukprot:scaffold3_cov273-Pinguiococcus_pyrenoidosus.AAC.16
MARNASTGKPESKPSSMRSSRSSRSVMYIAMTYPFKARWTSTKATTAVTWPGCVEKKMRLLAHLDMRPRTQPQTHRREEPPIVAGADAGVEPLAMMVEAKNAWRRAQKVVFTPPGGRSPVDRNLWQRYTPRCQWRSTSIRLRSMCTSSPGSTGLIAQVLYPQNTAMHKSTEYTAVDTAASCGNDNTAVRLWPSPGGIGRPKRTTTLKVGSRMTKKPDMSTGRRSQVLICGFESAPQG